MDNPTQHSDSDSTQDPELGVAETEPNQSQPDLPDAEETVVIGAGYDLLAEQVKTVEDHDEPDAPTGIDPVIRLIDVDKSFGRLHVLDQLSLAIQPSEVTVIVGPSGVGKSVILKHIAGLLEPDSGQVWFEDQRIDQMNESQLVHYRKKIGYLFQMGALFDSMNVEKNICFPLTEHSQISAAERHHRCHQVLKMVGLPEIARKMPAELSGGQQKRVALARAIVLEPQVVLYDEPTTGLDPIRADLINELIVSLDERLGITSIVVTHDMTSAYRIADRMVMIHNGKIVADGIANDFEQSHEEIVRRFVRGEANQDDLDRIRAGFEPREKK